MFRSVEARGYERFESYRVSSIEKLLLSKGNGRGRNSSTCLFIPGDPGIKYLHRAVVERGPWKVGRRSHVRGEVSSLHTRGWIATTRRSNDLQRPCKSYSLSGAAEGRLGEKYCFWFSPGVSNEGSTANMCPWNSTLMNADVFNQGDWRDLAKRRSGIERVLRNTLEARFRCSPRNVMGNILDRRYNQNFALVHGDATSHRHLSIKFQSTRCETSDSR